MCLSPLWCSLCKKNGENVDQILLHCSFSSTIWAKLLDQFGIVGAFPERWSDDFLVISLVLSKIA